MTFGIVEISVRLIDDIKKYKGRCVYWEEGPSCNSYERIAKAKTCTKHPHCERFHASKKEEMFIWCYHIKEESLDDIVGV